MSVQLAAQIFVKDGPSWIPYAIGIGTALTALVAGLTAIIGLTSIRQNHKDAVEKHKQEKDNALQARSLHYMERYDARHNIGPRDRLNKFFVMIKPTQQGERIKEWEEMTFKQATLTVQGLNFWEELGGMYNRDLVDRNIVDDYFGPEAEHIWKRIAWFVTYKRNEDPDAMIEMQRMCETIRSRRHARGKPVEPLSEPTTGGLGRPPVNTSLKGARSAKS